MLENIATLLSSGAFMVSFLSIFWIWRTTKHINTISVLFAVVITAFSLWQWYHHATDLSHSGVHDIGAALFIMFVTGANNFYTCVLRNAKTCVGINRRKEQKEFYDSPVDRRSGPHPTLEIKYQK